MLDAGYGIQDAGCRMQDVRESLLIPYPESRIQNPESRIQNPESRILHPVSVASCVTSVINTPNTTTLGHVPVVDLVKGDGRIIGAG